MSINNKTILHFFPRFFPYSWGGAENYIHGLINYQKKIGNKIYLLCTYTENDLHKGLAQPLTHFNHHQGFEYEYEGIHIICIKPIEFDLYNYSLYKRVKGQSLSFIEDWQQIFQFFYKGEIITDLHVHSYERSFIYPHYLQALKNLNTNLRVYTHCHDAIPCIKNTLVTDSGKPCDTKVNSLSCIKCSTTFNEVPKSHHAYFYLKAKHAQLQAMLDVLAEHDRQTEIWICYSEIMKDYLAKNSFIKKKVVIKHGVKPFYLDNPHPSKSKLSLNFAYFGRFVRAKGLHNLLSTWNQLPELPERKLYLIGEIDNHTDNEIIQLIETSRKRSDIVFLGKKRQAEIASILDEMHCVIIPSVFQEIGPLVLFEALARKCNIIASNLGGMKEYASIHHATDVKLFKHDDLDELGLLIQDFKYHETETLNTVFSEDEHFAKITEITR